jgi:hypothetical protein
MSVYYSVTRSSGPFAKDGREISEAEWQAIVAADPDLQFEEPGSTLGLRYPGTWAVWHSYPSGYPAWFALRGGDIEVKGIDDALLGKLRGFATILGARIFCETGEELA